MLINDVIEKIERSMLPIKGGEFMMGDIFRMYKPVIITHKIDAVLVKVDDFHICNHTITNAEWAGVMEETIDDVQLCDLPKINVSWHDAMCFIERLNQKSQNTYRLPTEAEWEFAARGGTCSEGHFFSGKNFLDFVGWYKPNSNKKLHAVCKKQPNELGVYDMSGNVWEWCSDFYATRYQKGERKGIFTNARYPIFNPSGPLLGDCRVLRGGAYDSDEQECWLFYRNKKKPSYYSKSIGFRLAY